MKRSSTLPGGCKSLSDTVRVVALGGQQLPLMTLAEAQKLAKDQNAELVHIETGHEPVFGLLIRPLKASSGVNSDEHTTA